MDNHKWRLSQAYTYALYISKHISITLIPYHLIFLLHVKLFLLHVLCLWHIPLSILFLYSYFYTLHIPILIMCSSFTLVICLFNVPILFQVTYHVSSLSFSSFGSIIYCILCTITYIIPYLSHILCLFLVTCLYRILSLLFLCSYIIFISIYIVLLVLVTVYTFIA